MDQVIGEVGDPDFGFPCDGGLNAGECLAVRAVGVFYQNAMLDEWVLGVPVSTTGK